MKPLSPTILHACHALGVPDALDVLAIELASHAAGADDAWQTWLAMPAFVRREIDPHRAATLDKIRRDTQADVDRFQRNPLAVLPVQVALVHPSMTRSAAGTMPIALATEDGQRVAVLQLEIGEG